MNMDASSENAFSFERIYNAQDTLASPLGRGVGKADGEGFTVSFSSFADVISQLYRLMPAGHIPLLRYPKSLIGLERRAILTAAPSSPRFIVRRTRFGDDARSAKDAKRSFRVLAVRTIFMEGT